MRATVDADRCGGHGICVQTCPDVFALTDDGYAEAVAQDVPDALLPLVHRALGRCPEHAIAVTS